MANLWPAFLTVKTGQGAFLTTLSAKLQIIKCATAHLP